MLSKISFMHVSKLILIWKTQIKYREVCRALILTECLNAFNQQVIGRFKGRSELFMVKLLPVTTFTNCRIIQKHDTVVVRSASRQASKIRKPAFYFVLGSSLPTVFGTNPRNFLQAQTTASWENKRKFLGDATIEQEIKLSWQPERE